MIVYISGGITGIDDFYNNFEKAEMYLTSIGYKVINPAKINNELPDNITYEQYMDIDFAMLRAADAIYMLDGWQKSLGANRELGFAMGLGLNIFYECIRMEGIWTELSC